MFRSCQCRLLYVSESEFTDFTDLSISGLTPRVFLLQVCEWYERFKKEYPDLWKISEVGMQEITAFEKNPPDLSHLNHPVHPSKKKAA